MNRKEKGRKMETPGFFRLIKNEFREIPKNNALLFSVFALLALVFLIGFIYQMGVLNSLSLVLVDQDQSSASRMISRAFTENQKFTVIPAPDYLSAVRMIHEGKAGAGVIIPEGISRDIKEQKTAELLLIVDGTNYIAANSAYSKANEILQTLNGGIATQILEGKDFLPEEAKKIVQKVALQQKILYNSDYNYAYYLSYGIFSAGVFSLAMSAIALTLAQQRKKNAFCSRDLTVKIMIYGLFSCAVSNVVFKLAQIVFHLPDRGSWIFFLSLTLPYGVLIAAFALILFSLAKEEVRILQAAVYFATSLFFCTGYTWPFQSIPEILRPLYYLNPLTPFLNGVRACFVMGCDFGVISNYIWWQLAQILLYSLFAFLFYRLRWGKPKTP